MGNRDLPNKSTSELVAGIQENGPGKEYQYDALQVVLSRWRQSIDLEILIDLLESESSNKRLLGAHYLTELGQEVEGLNLVTIRLANDVIADCRRAFVAYVGSSGNYDEKISGALAKCLSDLNLYVRVAVIRWAIQTSEEQFKDFSLVVQAGTGKQEPRFSNPLSNDFWNDANLRRAIRGLNIIDRIRKGEDIQQIRSQIPEEDSFVFDNIQFSNTRRERLAKWQEGLRSA